MFYNNAWFKGAQTVAHISDEICNFGQVWWYVTLSNFMCFSKTYDSFYDLEQYMATGETAFQSQAAETMSSYEFEANIWLLKKMKKEPRLEAGF